MRLRWLILAPFLLIYSAIAVTLTWWTYRAGIHEAEELGDSLHRHAGARVRAELDRLFDTPVRLLAANVTAAETGLLALDDSPVLEEQFAVQVRAFPNLTNLSFGSARGDYTCAYRDWTASDRINIASAGPGQGLVSFLLDAEGRRVQTLGPTPGFEVTQRPWYLAGKSSNEATWYPVYPFFSGESLGVGMAQAVRVDDGSLLGVMAADISLHEVAQLLGRLELKEGAIAFVMEENGQLIADSSRRSPIRQVEGVPGRISLTEEDAGCMGLAARATLASPTFGAIGVLSERLECAGQAHLLHSDRYVRTGGLSLIVSIVAPRSAYIAPLTAGVNRRAWLAAALVLLGLAAALRVSRMINRPIQELGEAAHDLAAGDGAGRVPPTRILEIQSLSDSFATMAERLRSTLASLESQVAERTRELAEANARLGHLSRTDELTGLANRRHLDQEFSREWKRARRDRLPLSLMLADVDWFKAFNDRYGHVVGDECLQELAKTLSGAARRDTDLVARLGGEEFVILLPGVDQEQAALMAESVRRGVEDLRLEHRDSTYGCVTISVGVAGLDSSGSGPEPSDPKELLEAADRALYAAKSGGRNRVHAAGADTPGGK